MTVSDDLGWWQAHRTSQELDPAVLEALLGRLQAWKAAHDRDRAAQPGPFLKMAWDGVFGDEDGRVSETIAEIETSLARST